MKSMLSALLTGFLLFASAAAEELTGEWLCTYEETGYRTTRGLKFLSGKLIHTDGFGRRVVEKEVVVSSNYVFWNRGEIQEFEFFPVKNRLVEKTRLLGTETTMTYVCERHE